MCLQSDASSRLDNIGSMETVRSRDKHLVKDCRVVLVPLVRDIARRKTVKVFSVGNYVFASRESSNCDLLVLEKNGYNAPPLPLSLYSTVNNGIITEVKCEDYRKRKCYFGAEMEAEDEVVVAKIVKNLLDRIASEPVITQSIDFTSPGPKEIQLVNDFCRENGYESSDYQDLESLFTFRTLPSLESEETAKPANKRCKTVKKNANRRNEVTKTSPSNDVSASGLEKIKNLKIRKILEDFGRLSKSEENIRAPKQKKIRIDSNSTNKNSSFNKPLNLCKKDNREMEKPVKISKSVQSDISISGSILRTLLHHQENLENSKENGGKEWRENTTQRHAPVENQQKKAAKKSIAQQTDAEDKMAEKTQIEANNRNDKWLNDPTAILKKIHKLKKDILYLDLLAEEKEKERIAILCFKNYKESILKKIFASEMSEDSTEVSRAANHVIDTPSVSIPKLIHPSSNSAMEHRPLNSVLFPSNNSFVEGHNSYAALRDDQINENFVRLRNCTKCDFVKSSFLNPSYRSPWYCNPLCQTHSCSQHEKECRGFIVDSSTK